MKNILCFGDSNTWGYAPGTGYRYPFDQRWTGVLQQALIGDTRIIEEGLNGRTTLHDDEHRDFKNGLALLPVFLQSHAPLDLVIIMLGTNDLKTFFDLSAEQIAQGAQALCQTALSLDYPAGECPQILLVSPAFIEPITASGPPQDAPGFSGAIEKSRQFAPHYKAVADALGIHFFDAAPLVQTSPVDGVHWAATQHEMFGLAMAEYLPTIFQR
ncbi:MAG: lysophospholipase L1-like esterase [Phenylobacterium sp.]|jgi:lysophospholipase L1-like esterase